MKTLLYLFLAPIVVAINILFIGFISSLIIDCSLRDALKDGFVVFCIMFYNAIVAGVLLLQYMLKQDEEDQKQAKERYK